MPPAPYWHSYAYDGLGNCETDVDHATTAGGSDTSTSYVCPPQGGIQPHTLSSSTTTKGSTTTTNSHTYDGAGNTHTRTPDGKTRTLDWEWQVTDAHDTAETALDATPRTRPGVASTRSATPEAPSRVLVPGWVTRGSSVVRRRHDRADTPRCEGLRPGGPGRLVQRPDDEHVRSTAGRHS
ncbi:hypothetical protein [Streptomyces sp. NPDC004270]